MLATIEFLQSRLEVRRHVTGAELAWACRDFAVRAVRAAGPPVLAYWGIRRTDDYRPHRLLLGRAGLLSALPTDREEDFAGVYEFGEAFREPYAWDGVAELVAVSGAR